MPQVWLSYEEIADLYRCSPADARRGVIENQWPRRRSGDGLTRVKLPPGSAHQFMLDYATQFATLPSTDEMITALRGVLDVARRDEPAHKTAIAS